MSSDSKRGKATPSSVTPSLPQIAARAGVSLSTASRVLRDGPTRVSPELSERVRRAADEFGYVPNLVAQSLRQGRQASIGLVVGDMLDPYFGEIAEAVTLEANSSSLLAMVSNMQRDRRLELEHCRRLWGHRVTGLVLAAGAYVDSPYRDELATVIRRMQATGIVVVALAPRDIDVPTICVDNEEVGGLVASRLVAEGHRRIGLVGGSEKNVTQRLRLAGIRRTLAVAGVEPVVVHKEFSVEAGAQGLEEILQLEPRVTAVIGGSDRVAYGIMTRLRELGRRIPEEVSVVGIGDTTLARVASPRLTTVDVKLAESGRAAVRYIVAREAGTEWTEPMRLQAALVEGATVCRAGA
jgi:Transcriptional regulators